MTRTEESKRHILQLFHLGVGVNLEYIAKEMEIQGLICNTNLVSSMLLDFVAAGVLEKKDNGLYYLTWHGNATGGDVLVDF